jgi:hypothetical protein
MVPHHRRHAAPLIHRHRHRRSTRSCPSTLITFTILAIIPSHRQSAPSATPTQFHFPPTHIAPRYHPDLATNSHHLTSTASAAYSFSSSCPRQYIHRRTNSSEGGPDTHLNPAPPTRNNSHGETDYRFHFSETHHLGTIRHWWHYTNRHLQDRDDQPWSASPPSHHNPESIGR